MICRLCSAKHYARGLCNTCYSRHRRQGRFETRELKKPMDPWEKRRVTRLLAQGLSYRKIQESTGVGYRTVCRFAQGLKRAGAAC